MEETKEQRRRRREQCFTQAEIAQMEKLDAEAERFARVIRQAAELGILDTVKTRQSEPLPKK